MEREAISPDGKWATYSLKYAQADTLFVQHIATGEKKGFPSGGNATFSHDAKWLRFTLPNSIALYHLESGKVQYFEGATQSDFIENTPYTILKISHGATDSIYIVDLSRGMPRIKFAAGNFSSYAISPKGKIALSGPDGVMIVHTADNFKIQEVVKDKNAIYGKMVWSKQGNALAFSEVTGEKDRRIAKVGYYGPEGLKILDPSLDARFGEKIISLDPRAPLLFSEDGLSVIFTVSPPARHVSTEVGVEIWDALSPLEYPRQKWLEDPTLHKQVTLWHPSSDRLQIIASPKGAVLLFTPDRKYCIHYTTLPYEPQLETDGWADYYITDLAGGHTQLLFKQQTSAIGNLSFSENGNLIAYFKGSDWFVYNIEKELHLNLTAGLTAAFTAENDNAGSKYACGSPGWTANSKELLVYDRNGIWALSVDGHQKECLTCDLRTHTSFRICERAYPSNIRRGPVDLNLRIFDLKKGILLECLAADKIASYALWKKGEPVHYFPSFHGRQSRLQKAKNTDTYLYFQEAANLPPQLVTYHAKKESVLFQSNAHYRKYKQGAASLIGYANAKGEHLSGILYYPVDFSPEKQYPMVVYLYEKLSDGLYEYHNPTTLSPIGFSPANYTADGYLVLFVDISFEVGNPGISATDCVLAAVRKVKEMGIVKNRGIGIIGHSFGGYLVNFIITQTDGFTAAVAGAPTTDLISSYLTINNETGYGNAWRYETQQLRMGNSPYGAMQNYLDNSPVIHADKITTPLLSWSGKEDLSVSYTQNMEMHLALRRLGKKSLMLLYPAEGHTLEKLENRQDLTGRTKKWFDTFLKD